MRDFILKSVVFSFFSGAGFLDLGFEDSEFEVVFVNELDSSFASSYAHSRNVMGYNTPRYGHHITSIEELVGERGECLISDAIAREKDNLVGFVGGPPCPDFSVGGKNKGREGENGKLSQSYINCIKQHNPDWFVFENVKGLWRTKKHREFYEDLKVQLLESGYVLQDRLINSLEFGVPQDRDRIILFGIKQELAENRAESLSWEKYMKYPQKTALEYSWPKTNGFGEKVDVPEDVPIELTVQFWFDKNNVLEHPNAKHHFTPRAGLTRFLQVEEGDTSKKSFKRLHRYRYSPTAAYGNNEVHLHPCEARRISAAEAMAIQSLPANFELPKTMTLSAMFKTIGNGVPYLFSLGIAKTIKDYLEE